MTAYDIPLPRRFTHHRMLVNLVATAGVEPPKRWRDLDRQLDAYLAVRNHAAQKLADQVVNPTKNVDLPTLRALALAEQAETPGAVASVLATVVTAVEAAMLDAISETARANYDRVAQMFNEAAQTFTAAAAITHPEADASTIITANDEQRSAWVIAEVEAAKLEKLLPALLAACQLCGVRIDTADERLAQIWYDSPIDQAAVIGLTVDPGKAHRRRVWEAWETDGGRTGKWGALTSLTGVTIRAADLDDFTRYDRPRPLIHKQEQILGEPRGTVRNVTIDPEDPGYIPPVEPDRTGKLVDW